MNASAVVLPSPFAFTRTLKRRGKERTLYRSAVHLQGRSRGFTPAPRARPNSPPILATSALLDYDTELSRARATFPTSSLRKGFRPDSLVVNLDGSVVVDIGLLDWSYLACVTGATR
ncbi:hypothetical protein FS837_000204, partial [Tulasnella sp. UAMH 9824]